MGRLFKYLNGFLMTACGDVSLEISYIHYMHVLSWPTFMMVVSSGHTHFEVSMSNYMYLLSTYLCIYSRLQLELFGLMCSLQFAVSAQLRLTDTPSPIRVGKQGRCPSWQLYKWCFYGWFIQTEMFWPGCFSSHLN